MSQKYEKLKTLLRELFQLDQPATSGSYAEVDAPLPPRPRRS